MFSFVEGFNMLNLLLIAAFILCGFPIIYFALVGVGLRWIGIRQFSDTDTGGLDRKAAGQDQCDDFQALISLGFKPVGRYREQFGWFDSNQDEIAMIHCELPVCCYLKVLPTGIAIVKLMSDDLNGRFVVTTTRDVCGQAADEHDFYLQPRWAESPERLFEAQIVALKAREQDGFHPAAIADMSGLVAQRKRYFQHRKVQSFLRRTFLSTSTFYVMLSLALPAFLAFWVYGFNVETQHQSSRPAAEISWTVFAILSIVSSCLILRWKFGRSGKRKAVRPKIEPSNSVPSFQVPVSLRQSD